MKPFWSTGNSVKQVDFSPDSKRLACMRISDVYVCNLEDPFQQSRVIVATQETSIHHQTWSLDSTRLAILQKDSPVIVISRFDQDIKAGDEEQFIELKATGKAVLCGWNVNGWLAIVTSSGKVWLFHEKHGTRICATTINGGVSLASNDAYWAFSVAIDGIHLCASDDCSLIRKISIPYSRPTEILSFSPNVESDSLLAFDGEHVMLAGLRTRKLNLVETEAPALTCGWCEVRGSLMVVCGDGFRLKMIEYCLGDSDAISLVVKRKIEIESSPFPLDVFYLNAGAGGLCYGFDSRNGYQICVATSLATSQIKFHLVGLVKESIVTHCVISGDGVFVASTSNEIVQLSRILTSHEQILDCLTRPFTVFEFFFSFLVVGSALALLILSLMVRSYPWQVLDTALEIFCLPHYHL